MFLLSVDLLVVRKLIDPTLQLSNQDIFHGRDKSIHPWIVLLFYRNYLFAKSLIFHRPARGIGWGKERHNGEMDGGICSTHSIRRVVLEEIVLRNLREAIQYVTQYEDDFVQRAADQSLRERDKELAQKKDTLTQSQKRIAELDVIIKRLYEDNISGKLSDERFIKLSRDYELEQTNLTNLVEHLRQEVKEQEKQKVNVRQFIAAVRKYTDMQQLDASVLREFVEKIYISEVYTPDENEPRIKVREIEIVYNFIGAFDFEEAREQSQAAQKEKKTGVA